MQSCWPAMELVHPCGRRQLDLAWALLHKSSELNRAANLPVSCRRRGTASPWGPHLAPDQMDEGSAGAHGATVPHVPLPSWQMLLHPSGIEFLRREASTWQRSFGWSRYAWIATPLGVFGCRWRLKKYIPRGSCMPTPGLHTTQRQREMRPDHYSVLCSTKAYHCGLSLFFFKWLYLVINLWFIISLKKMCSLLSLVPLKVSSSYHLRELLLAH